MPDPEPTSVTRDYFSEMGLPRRASLDHEAIKERFHELSRRLHPDSGSEPDSEGFERLNRAQQELMSPQRRVWHLLELTVGAAKLEKKGGVDGQLVDLFSKVGRVIADATRFLRKRESVSTVLGKALIESESIGIQKQLVVVNTEIGDIISGYEDKFTRLDEMILNSPAEAVDAGLEIWRALTFLEKWRGQIQEKFAQMF